MNEYIFPDIVPDMQSALWNEKVAFSLTTISAPPILHDFSAFMICKCWPQKHQRSVKNTERHWVRCYRPLPVSSALCHTWSFSSYIFPLCVVLVNLFSLFLCLGALWEQDSYLSWFWSTETNRPKWKEGKKGDRQERKEGKERRRKEREGL
jgi:hypothetical protein